MSPAWQNAPIVGQQPTQAPTQPQQAPQPVQRGADPIVRPAPPSVTPVQQNSMETQAARLAMDRQGNPGVGYRIGPDGDAEYIPGGPADLKINAAGVAKTNDAKDVLGLLDEVDALLPKATGSYIGAGVDALAGSAGYGTKGAESTAQLKALEGALVSKMPKMSGPQSDKDVLLYKQMAGQVGDNTIPVNQRQAASRMIRKLNERYAGVAEGSSRPASAVDSLLDKYK